MYLGIFLVLFLLLIQFAIEFSEWLQIVFIIVHFKSFFFWFISRIDLKPKER